MNYKILLKNNIIKNNAQKERLKLKKFLQACSIKNKLKFYIIQ